MIDDFLERVRTGLDRLRQADPKGGLVFGAEDHGYRLHEPLGEGAVRAFEEGHGISLPPDYRAFITRAGNGGAGPFYGLFRLGEMDDGHDFVAWSSGDFVGNPRGAFPFRESWNLPPGEIEELLQSEDEEEQARRYWFPIDGALPLCHEGCALRVWLVVTGPEAGHLWHDSRADYGGWMPLTDASGQHMTFEAWYTNWLDSALKSLPSVAVNATEEEQAVIQELQRMAGEGVGACEMAQRISTRLGLGRRAVMPLIRYFVKAFGLQITEAMNIGGWSGFNAGGHMSREEVDAELGPLIERNQSFWSGGK